MNEENHYYEQRIYNLKREEAYIREDPSLSVQSYINNFSFPSSLDELRIDIEDNHSSLEVLLDNEEVNWSVPKWTKPGDIVFFMYARTAIQKITALVTELNREKDSLSDEEYDVMSAWLAKHRQLYAAYGGKILAIGRVAECAQYSSPGDDEIYQPHYHSRFFTDIHSVIILENPIDLSEFKSFITLTLGGAITPVFGNEFERLRSVIGAKNKLPRYVTESVSIPVPLRKITKDNWLKIAGKYRRNFIFEQEFRTFYVNYLLLLLGDRKRIFRECRCCKPINPDSYVDNVIVINGRYLSVEVKLNINAERHIKTQVIKYCNVERCYLKNGKPEYIDYNSMYEDNALIIDTEKIYLYDAETDMITELFDLDNLHAISDIMELRKLIASKLKKPVYDRNRQIRKSAVYIRNMDICYIAADAIVNAANAHLNPGSGVCYAIFRTAGYHQLNNACKKISYCKAGSAVITPAFNLQAKYIIHAVGPKWFDGKHNESSILYSAYTESLKLAMQYECHSIAFPLLSTGALRYPADQAWQTALKACHDFFDQNPEYKIIVVFVSQDQRIINLGKSILNA